MSQYSPLKTAIIWVGAILVTAIALTAITIGMRIDAQNSTDQYEACFKSGQTAAECAVALN